MLLADEQSLPRAPTTVPPTSAVRATLALTLMPSRQLPHLVACLLLAMLAGPAAAAAAPVTVLGDDDRARTVSDRVPTPAGLPSPPGWATSNGFPATGGEGDASGRSTGPVARSSRTTGRAVRTQLRRLLRRRAIDKVRHDELRSAYDRALATARRLAGRRGVELSGVLAIIDGIAARRQLTAGRLAPLWLTLERNERWWRVGPLPASGQRVQFEGSQMLWQYVPGQGLHAHPLANFGRLNGFWLGGRSYHAAMAQLLDELLALRVERAGGVAWEYYFHFGPSRAPWVSGMAQGTAVQAITRASQRLARSTEIAPIVDSGLAVFETPPPVGVRIPSGPGAHYLLYSGDPGLRVLNGFVQALSGLQTVAAMTANPRADSLYREGRAALAREVSASDTGAWSLYSLGRVSQESSLHYHQLLTEFLGNLCRRTEDALYCETEARFAGYVREPPQLTLLSTRVRAGTTGALRFRLSKRSLVSLRVEHRGRVVAHRSLGSLPYGRRYTLLSPPRRRSGAYAVILSATDLAGNRGAVSAPVEILPARRMRRGGSQRGARHDR